MTTQQIDPVALHDENGQLLKLLFGSRAADANYLMNISTKFCYIYYELPKVACSTIKRSLQLLEVDKIESELPEYVHDKEHSPLASPNTLNADLGRMISDSSVFKFLFVRNPFSRAVSGYLDKIVINQSERQRMLPELGFSPDETISFVTFLRAVREQALDKMDIHWAPQSHLCGAMIEKMDFTGRFESFEEDFSVVLGRLSGQSDGRGWIKTLNPHKTDASAKVTDFVGAAERKLIQDIYSDDFRLFRYNNTIPSGEIFNMNNEFVNFESKYIASQANNAAVAENKLESLNKTLEWCQQLPASCLPPVKMMNTIGSHDAIHFVGNMRNIFSEMVRRSGVTSGSHVLDIGCGCGRFALPFSNFLVTGKYYGVDVWRDGIKWCMDNITANNSNCVFMEVEAKDNYYFSDNRSGEDNDFSLIGIPDESIDFSFAISVFTHLIKKDCVDYFREISRVLKNDGAFLCTGFLIDRFFWDFRKRTGNHSGLLEKESGCFYAYSRQDFFAGYSMPIWQEMFSAAGLRIEGFELGSWAAKPMASHYQDWFILMKS